MLRRPMEAAARRKVKTVIGLEPSRSAAVAMSRVPSMPPRLSTSRKDRADPNG